MKIRLRVRGPAGVTPLDADDSWTLTELLQLVREKTGIAAFSLKYGWPLKDLNTEGADHLTLGSLRLTGETLLVQPLETSSGDTAAGSGPSERAGDAIAVPSQEPTPASRSVPAPFNSKSASSDGVDNTMVEWPEKGGNLVLRVMPDDNSCLFTAFGGAIKIDNPSTQLRHEIAKYIETHPDEYTKVILDNMEPARYIQRILQPDTWGGAIELGILSKLYDIQICSIDVKSLRVDTFGEDNVTRCIIVYSGVHYDRIAFVPDILGPNADVEFDETRWDADDDEILTKAQDLVKKLQNMHYYTDSSDFVVRCTVCDWIGQGQSQVAEHQKQTRHADFEELKID